MKIVPALVAFILVSYNDQTGRSDTSKNPDSASTTKIESPSREAVENDTVTSTEPVTYGNARFKDVTVAKTGTRQYTVTGRGQIFEASFNWVIEDGHNELKSGFTSTDAGAPEWGNFKFTIDIPEKRPNSTLTLVIYETSAKDGSRQHELAIPLQD